VVGEDIVGVEVGVEEEVVEEGVGEGVEMEVVADTSEKDWWMMTWELGHLIHLIFSH